MGRVDVEQMLDGMSSEQLIGWLAYYGIEPFGYDINNYRSGVVAAAVMNSVRGKESDKVWSHKDFFIDNTAVKQQNWNDQLAIATTIVNVYSGKEK